MITWGTKQAELILAPFDRCVDWLEGTPRSGKTTAGTMRFARHLIRSRDNIHLVTAYSAEQAYRLIMDGDGMGLLHIFKGCCTSSKAAAGHRTTTAARIWYRIKLVSSNFSHFVDSPFCSQMR